MEPQVYAYFVDAGPHDVDSVRLALGQQQLDDAWLRISELTLERSGRRLLALELFDLDTGGPLDVPPLALRLSGEGRHAWLFAVDPTGQGAAFEHYEGGEQRYAWGGRWETFDDELGQGREGFLARVAAEGGLDWEEVTAAAAALPRFDDVADEHTDLLLRGRLLAMPVGMARRPELFRLHYVEALYEEGEDDEGGEDGDARGVELDPQEPEGDEHLLVLLLDPQLTRFLWEEAPASHVAAFLRAVEPVRGAVLGPLAHAFPDVLGMVEAQPPDRPLARSPLRELLVYEVLSMATAVAFLAGDTVSYYERLFFPLLGLAEGEAVPDAVRECLEEIQELDTLRAMVEVLPYSAPEGELLECFGDQELTPLAAWAESDGVYEGSLFLLDATRIGGMVERFDGEGLARLMEQFRQVWADVLPPGNEWHAGQADLDEEELALFRDRLDELRRLLALADVNRLQPAIFFYD